MWTGFINANRMVLVLLLDKAHVPDAILFVFDRDLSVLLQCIKFEVSKFVQ